MSQPSIRLLLAMNDSAGAERLRHAFTQEGFAVTVCGSAATAAMQLSGPEPWQLLILDAGFAAAAAALCHQVRGLAAPMPVLMLGSGDTEAERVWGLEVGADDVLPVPFGLAECLARCRALLRRHQLGCDAPTELRCGPVLMRVEEHRVSRNGREVNLAPREFRLLQFLLEHPRRTWSRDAILRRVWGEQEAIALDPKTVDVHIRWLRQKLEDDPAHPTLITTVRGQGYRCG